VNSAFDYVSSNSGEPTRAIGGRHSRAVVRVEVDVKNQVQLITYVDRRAGNFKLLKSLLTSSLAGLFGGVHLLPFFAPIDGADAGFDPTDHTQVDSRLGNWGDVRGLSEQAAVVQTR
jgi:sucrose phosphorylase